MASNNPATYTFDDDTDMSVKAILETFIITTLHPWKGKRADWLSCTIVICRITNHDTRSVVIRKNVNNADERVHAEMVLFNEIEKMANLSKSEIKIFLTYSPCDECSPKLLGTAETPGRLLALQHKFPNLKKDLIMTFSGFYKIKLPTCNECYCRPDNETLKKLMDLDASPMEKKDWDELIELLTEYDKEKQKKDETHSLTDLKGIRYGEKYGKWRDWEDKRMMDGYKEMRDKLLLHTPPDRHLPLTDPPTGREKRRKTEHVEGASTRNLFPEIEKQAHNQGGSNSN